MTDATSKMPLPPVPKAPNKVETTPTTNRYLATHSQHILMASTAWGIFS